MKVRAGTLYFILFHIFGILSSAWNPYLGLFDREYTPLIEKRSFLSAFFDSGSRVPQLIRDTRHPWMDENQAWLHRLNDPQQALCALNSTLRSNGTDEWKYPADLFRRLEIDNNRYDVNRAGWTNAVERLREMLACPAALADVQTLYVDIFVHDESLRQYGSPWEESWSVPEELPALFADTLASMSALDSLTWRVRGGYGHEFEETFVKRNLTLPSMRSLKGMACDYLIPMSPNLEAIEATEGTWKDHQSLLEFASGAKRLLSLTIASRGEGSTPKHMEGETSGAWASP
jgi:hypothetical protein